jgi:hypothetical protein
MVNIADPDQRVESSKEKEYAIVSLDLLLVGICNPVLITKIL